MQANSIVGRSPALPNPQNAVDPAFVTQPREHLTRPTSPLRQTAFSRCIPNLEQHYPLKMKSDKPEALAISSVSASKPIKQKENSFDNLITKTNELIRYGLVTENSLREFIEEVKNTLPAKEKLNTDKVKNDENPTKLEKLEKLFVNYVDHKSNCFRKQQASAVTRFGDASCLTPLSDIDGRPAARQGYLGSLRSSGIFMAEGSNDILYR